MPNLPDVFENIHVLGLLATGIQIAGMKQQARP